jgi:hypothetical protein
VRHYSRHQLKQERQKMFLIGAILICIGMVALAVFFVRGGF